MVIIADGSLSWNVTRAEYVAEYPYLSIARNVRVCSPLKSSPKVILGTLNTPHESVSARGYFLIRISSFKNSNRDRVLSELYLISNGYFASGYVPPSLNDAETVILESHTFGRTHISSLA